MIILETSMGPIKIKLDFANTPATAQNFQDLAQAGFYEGTIFHRVIKGFMIQGGGFDEKMQHKPATKTIQNEADKSTKNKRGSLAMARTSDPHSASSQFFINTVDNGFLDYKSSTPNGWGYCVFGEVISGMEVVDQIEKAATTSKNGHQDVPVDAILIEKVIVEPEIETATE